MFTINIENFTKTKILYMLFTVSVVMNLKKIFKEEKSVDIAKILGLIDNIEEYQKIYTHG